MKNSTNMYSIILFALVFTACDSKPKKDDLQLVNNCLNAASTCEFQTGKKQNGDLQVCIGGIDFLKDNCHDAEMETFIPSVYDNTGVLYYYKDDKRNAYKSFFKAAKLGHKLAQKHLDILCSESSWACK